MNNPIRVTLAEIELMADDEFESHSVTTVNAIREAIQSKADPAIMKILADNIKDIAVMANRHG